MPPLPYTLTVYQGEDYERAVPMTDTGTNTPLDITGWTVAGQIRAGYSSTTVLHTLTLTPSGTDLIVEIPGSVSAAWPWRLARYDVKLTAPNGKATRSLQGSVVVYAEITRS